MNTDKISTDKAANDYAINEHGIENDKQYERGYSYNGFIAGTITINFLKFYNAFFGHN
jgi:hypothetical protein